jgi:hypothetical protein
VAQGGIEQATKAAIYSVLIRAWRRLTHAVTPDGLDDSKTAIEPMAPISNARPVFLYHHRTPAM